MCNEQASLAQPKQASQKETAASFQKLQSKILRRPQVMQRRKKSCFVSICLVEALETHNAALERQELIEP